MSGLLLVGASGLALEAAAVTMMLREHGTVAVVDDDRARWGTMHGLSPVLGTIDLAAAMQDQQLVLAMGRGGARRRVAVRLEMLGVRPDRYTSVVHPRIVLPGSCSFGDGTIALDGVVATADVEVGRHVVLMPQVTLTHGCVVSDYATLCAGVTLGGGVQVGEAAYVGMNASVREGVRIGADATVGMGSVVLHDVPAGETWVGVPARPIRTGAHL